MGKQASERYQSALVIAVPIFWPQPIVCWCNWGNWRVGQTGILLLMMEYQAVRCVRRCFATGKRSNAPRLGATDYPSTSPTTAKFIGMLTKGGLPMDKKICQAVFRLRIAFQMADPLAVAVDAVKPILQYKKTSNPKYHVLCLLNPLISSHLAIKWIIQSAQGRTFYSTKIPELEQGLYDEICAVFNGTSKVYQRRFQMHRNPN